MAQLQAVRGTQDLLPAEARRHRTVSETARKIAERYGFGEVATPIFEFTEVFARPIGETTDVVSKEMYTFKDRGGEEITLRPEMTAGIARAVLSNGLTQSTPLKFFSAGPVFRYERPQAGRYRQFHQIDAEAFGFQGPDIDAEMIFLSARLLKRLGLGGIKLLVNSLGTPEVRAVYRERLTAYFSGHEAALDEDSKRRLQGNPLRILDSKNPEMQRLIAGAPSMLEALDAESSAHFDELCGHLRAAGIAYDVEPRLVRGLDYYTRTVFEWTTDALGSQSTVCAGGRYDGLIAQLGGASTPGIGWAMGQERIVMLLERQAARLTPQRPHVYLVLAGERTEAEGLRLAEKLRDAWPELRMQMNLGGGSFKAQFKRADKCGAELALVLGEDELARGVVSLKALRREMAQEECPIDQISERLGTLLGLRRG